MARFRRRMGWVLIVLCFYGIGCGDSDDDDRRPTVTPISVATVPPPTATAPRPSSPTAAPSATAATGGRLDIAICAPAAGPFSATIDNPYFPLATGTQWILEGEDEEGVPVRLVITALDATEIVAGVTTRVVEERETEDDQLVEVSRNFFAQTADGTVCYYGEDVDIYEDGEIVSHEGAWRAGVEDARPGIFMPAEPQLGHIFAQEFAPGIAEDEAEIVAVGETVEVEVGTFTDTIRFLERNPLDSGTSEKIYGRNVGLLVDDSVERVME